MQEQLLYIYIYIIVTPALCIYTKGSFPPYIGTFLHQKKKKKCVL